ncbi:MAG: nucleotide exchange factor GrpE [Alphaproteobacteria bacterium]
MTEQRTTPGGKPGESSPSGPQAPEAAARTDSEFSTQADAGADPLVARVGALEAEIVDHKDRLLRALAETENVRRRAERERDDASRFAIASFAKDLLNVADNLRRALESVDAATRAADEKLNTLCQGIELTESELLAVFSRHGIEKIEPFDVPFNYERHEAIVELPNTGKPQGTVVQVFQPGYVLRERLLRPARVAVAKGDAPGGGAHKVDTTV